MIQVILFRFCVCPSSCMQEPQEISLGESYFANRFSGSKWQKVSCTDKFYFVSMLDTLKCLLSHEEYQAEVLNPHQSNDKLGDFCDGTAYKVHPLFSNDPQGLQIIGYYDELEIVNPLGSYVLKHKLGCLFFMLGNVRPKFRSTLKSIYLVAVGRNKDIEKYGIDEFLSPFVEDLKYCDGIDVSIGMYPTWWFAHFPGWHLGCTYCWGVQKEHVVCA